MKLINKNCIVVGGNKGIGREAALSLANEGANILVSYNTNQHLASEVVQKIQEKGCKAKSIKLDITDKQQILNLVKEAENFFGEIHVLVNSAGVLTLNPFMHITEEEFDRAIAIHLKAPFLLIQKIGEHMIKHQQGGSIINVASTSAIKATLNIAHYECAKAGLVMLTKSAAMALGKHKIRVNSISPGLTITDMTRPYIDNNDGNNPLGRIGMPKDHAGAIVFLASSAADWVTGINLIIDGGESTGYLFNLPK